MLTLQTHTNITPKHVKNLLTLLNLLTNSHTRLKYPGIGKFRATWFMSTDHRRSGKEQTQTFQISVQSWHSLFWPSCCAQAWYCVSICHLRASLMQWQVALQLSAVSTISFWYFFFPGSVRVFPHHFMMKSLIVFEDLRKLLSCFLIFQALEWKLSLCH